MVENSVKYIICFLILTFNLVAFAATKKGHSVGNEVINLGLKVNTQVGTIILFPEPVISITASKQYRIEPIRGTQDTASGAVADVAEFMVTPLKKGGAKAEDVTFIVFSNRAYNIKFVP